MKNNIKAYAIAKDGDMVRIAITYDVVGDNGKPVSSNVKENRFVDDPDILMAIAKVKDYAQNILDSTKAERP